MHRFKDEIITETKQQLQGGKGSVTLRHFLNKEDACGTGRLFAVSTINPGNSIGYHRHEGEFEVYYILQGIAKIVEDSETYLLHEGEMMQCKSGSSHSIESVGTEPLRHLALILTVRG